MASCPQPNQNTKEKGQSLESAKLEELVTACLCFSQTAPILWGGGSTTRSKLGQQEREVREQGPLWCVDKYKYVHPSKLLLKPNFLHWLYFRKKIV